MSLISQSVDAVFPGCDFFKKIETVGSGSGVVGSWPRDTAPASGFTGPFSRRSLRVLLSGQTREAQSACGRQELGAGPGVLRNLHE